jgi:tripartite-type tricarboxylate transporter receptor subunit TctC
MKKIVTMVSLILLAAMLFAGPQQESIDSYPGKDIRFIVPVLGGTAELNARQIANIMKTEGFVKGNINITTTVMTGGNTADAINAVINAAPEGYTFLLHHTNIITNHLSGNLKPSYEDMKMVAGISDAMFCIVARKDDNRWNDWAEFARDAKANPGKYSIGYSGFASPGHFSALQFLALTGASKTVRELPFDGTAAIVAAHLGGHIDLQVISTGTVIPYLESGDLKMLGVCSLERDPMFPDIMSLRDLGGVQDGIKTRLCFFTPKNTPDEIVQKFAALVKQAVDTPAFKEFCDTTNNTRLYRNSAEIKKIYDEDAVLLKDLMQYLSQ